MLSFVQLFEVSVSVAKQGNLTPPSQPKQPKVNTNIKSGGNGNPLGGALSSADAAKIIDRNNQGPQAKAVVNINPSSASEMAKSSANSASSAANRYGNQAATAGQRQSSLSSAYVTKPTRVPGRVNTNPTFSARGI